MLLSGVSAPKGVKQLVWRAVVPNARTILRSAKSWTPPKGWRNVRSTSGILLRYSSALLCAFRSVHFQKQSLRQRRKLGKRKRRLSGRLRRRRRQKRRLRKRKQRKRRKRKKNQMKKRKRNRKKKRRRENSEQLRGKRDARRGRQSTRRN